MKDKLRGYKIMKWRFKAMNQLITGKTFYTNNKGEVKKYSDKFTSEYSSTILGREIVLTRYEFF